MSHNLILSVVPSSRFLPLDSCQVQLQYSPQLTFVCFCATRPEDSTSLTLSPFLYWSDGPWGSHLAALWGTCIIFTGMFMFMLIINIHTNTFMHWAWRKQTFKWFLCQRTKICYGFLLSALFFAFKFNVLCKGTLHKKKKNK